MRRDDFEDEFAKVLNVNDCDGDEGGPTADS